ncbi:MAG: extracellular solute-binding protein [Opitutaceae bacterium]|nr:extracellular solute-binding protein [Opitutaceae bacterium]
MRLRSPGLVLLAAAYAVAVVLVWQRFTGERADGRVTIRISQWQLEGGVREGISAVIRRYGELNPRVRVIQIAVPDRVYLPWITTQLVGGIAPDIVEYSWTWPDLARFFAPITAAVMQPNPYNRGTPLAGVPWRDTFIEGMTSPDNYVQSLGQYYGVSMTTGMNRIVYNRALWRKIMGAAEPPATYREFLAACEKIQAFARTQGVNLVPLASSRTTQIALTNELVGSMCNGLAERLDHQHRLRMDTLTVGAAYLRGEWSYDTPELVAGFEVLRQVGAQCTPGFLQRERDTALTDFVTERAVMVVAPSYEASSLLKICPFELGAFRFPLPREDDPVYGRFARGPFSEGRLYTGMSFFVNRRTPHQAEAMDFLRFLGSQEASGIFARVSNWLPAVTGVQPTEFAAKFQIQSEGYNWQNNFHGPSNHPGTQNLLLSELHSLWGGQGSVAALRRELGAKMAEEIREGFRRDAQSGLANTRREDVAGAARVELARADARPETLRLIPVFNEMQLYQTRAVLAAPAR